MKNFQFRPFYKIPILVYQIPSYFINTPKNIKTIFVFCFCIVWLVFGWSVFNVSLNVSIIMQMLPLPFQVPPLAPQNHASLITGTLINQVHRATRLLTDNLFFLYTFLESH